jgi:hypothetical protein
MKTIFDKATRDGLIERVQALHEGSKAQWGKMNIHQMLRHCILCEEMYLGKTAYKRAFMGRLFGRLGLKQLLKDETPLKPNEPTSPHFIIAETGGDLVAEKREWISLLRQYEGYPSRNLDHWFFGSMTPEQVGQFVYKHTDHHLRQFGA